LYKAAEAVNDGEFVAKPVAEGDKFAVIWRRGSLAPSKRTLEAETAPIRQLLERQRADAALEALTAKLRADRVKDERPELLDSLPIELFGNKLPRSRPLPSAGPARPDFKKPEPTQGGLR
jgi:peptidyl-prolyl cis-trans isomerase C